MGRGGVEPPTSRLSGVRSNHLSYRPIAAPKQAIKAAGGSSLLGQMHLVAKAHFPVMKGHEDGGHVLWK